MKLLTKSLEQKLLKADHQNMIPIVKFFNPCGAATWLITKMEDDRDTLWGYCDLGMGCVEFGTVSLNELSNIRLRFGLGIERDLHWEPKKDFDYSVLLSRESIGVC
jgi:hypothetical protein